ncbi:unnamed protein product [Fusarium fujikuroi]|nr:unnamed protein product [Fusarium fujikuroi]
MPLGKDSGCISITEDQLETTLEADAWRQFPMTEGQLVGRAVSEGFLPLAPLGDLMTQEVLEEKCQMSPAPADHRDALNDLALLSARQIKSVSNNIGVELSRP